MLALAAAVIIYGSLYPFHFQFHRLPVNPLRILIHSWPLYQRRDIVVNVLVYVPLGAFAFLARRGWIGLLLALVLSGAMEMTQLFIPGRICSMLDVVSNVAGAAAGEAGAALFRGRRIACPSAFFLALCWISYQVFPFVPVFRRPHAPQPLSIVETFASAVEIVALLQFVELKYAFVLALVPLKVFIIGRTLSWSELAGVVLGCAVWFVVKDRPAVVPLLLAVSVVVQGLWPFRFTAAQAFVWVPFTGFLAGDWQWSFIVLFRKLFTYGSLVWFLWQSHVRLAHAALLTAALLAAIEAVQTHIAGRTAEISDPLIALLCAFTFVLATPGGCAKVKETNV